MDGLRSKYIATLTGGEVDILLQEKNATLLFADDEVSMYILR